MNDSHDYSKHLPSNLRLELWKRIDRHLQQGDILITNEQFLRVMEKDFLRLVKVKASPAIRQALYEMIVQVNEQYSDKYMAFGIRNAVTDYLNKMLSRLENDEEALKETRERLQRMVKEGRAAFFVESIGIEVGAKGLTPSVVKAIEKTLEVQNEVVAVAPKAIQPKARRKGANLVGVAVSETALSAEAKAVVAINMSLPNEKESAERTKHMQRYEKEIADEEMQRAHNYLDSYRDQDLIDDDDVAALHSLYSIDEQFTAGDIDIEEADRQRSKIDGKVREGVGEKLRAAVDYSVNFINAFEGLKRLPVECDGMLKKLVFHKHLVMADEFETDLGPLVGDLESDELAVESLSKLMEWRYHEVRMLSANLPPYRYVTSRGKLANLVIEESFIDELRSMDRETLSNRLNSIEIETRVKPAADIRCLVAFISQVIKLTPVHLAIRRLLIRQEAAKLYSSMSDRKNGRKKVNHFLSQSLPRLYPNMSSEETAATTEECANIMAEIDADHKKESKKEEVRVYRV
jgi:hypothetical protein